MKINILMSIMTTLYVDVVIDTTNWVVYLGHTLINNLGMIKTNKYTHNSKSRPQYFARIADVDIFHFSALLQKLSLNISPISFLFFMKSNWVIPIFKSFKLLKILFVTLIWTCAKSI